MAKSSDFSAERPEASAMNDGAQNPGEGPAGVHFASHNEEIGPNPSFDSFEGNATGYERVLPGGTEAEIRALSESMNRTDLQTRRMSNFNFEPISLPASRVESNESSSREASRQATQTSVSSRQAASPRISHMQTPPLTPSASESRENAGKQSPRRGATGDVEPAVDTPQVSAPPSSNIHTSRPGSSGMATAQTTISAESSAEAQREHGAFSIGPSRTESNIESHLQDISPEASNYTRPFTPAGEPDDPYAASKRLPQPKNLDAIEPRFVFSSLHHRRRTSPPSSGSLIPRSASSSGDLKQAARHGKKDPSLAHLNEDQTPLPSRGSMTELKRFLRIGNHGKGKRNASPSSTTSSLTGAKTPPHHKTAQQLPFGDDHGLSSRYGKFGKVLGAGAGGSVRLMKRSTDGTTFAVKEFRARHTYETEREYAKKVTAEFCIGSTLHHGNIIETLDIVQEKGRWYEVMEYAPYDLFAIVMTGKMSKEEVTCSFLQILSGVTYLHSMGLAHRDLKLDNVVVNEHGIMKIIDFGSASMFKYPFENEIVLGSGIVGSDPYLAPEVYDEKKYDPQPADIWSLAIIFCCMSLRRFPWKMPRMTDNSYKLFVSAPTPGTEGRPSFESTYNRTSKSGGVVPKAADATEPQKKLEKPRNTALQGPASLDERKPEVIKGPWRLLRLLPRESRHIIGRMLEIDPRKRATMAEVLEDPWISGTLFCRQDSKTGRVVHASGHTHTLEGPTPPPVPK